MTETELVSHLRGLRYGRPPSIRSVMLAAGMPRQMAYVAMQTGHIPEAHKAALVSVMQRVIKGSYYNPRSDGL